MSIIPEKLINQAVTFIEDENISLEELEQQYLDNYIAFYDLLGNKLDTLLKSVGINEKNIFSNLEKTKNLMTQYVNYFTYSGDANFKTPMRIVRKIKVDLATRFNLDDLSNYSLLLDEMYKLEAMYYKISKVDWKGLTRHDQRLINAQVNGQIKDRGATEKKDFSKFLKWKKTLIQRKIFDSIKYRSFKGKDNRVYLPIKCIKCGQLKQSLNFYQESVSVWGDRSFVYVRDEQVPSSVCNKCSESNTSQNLIDG